jgi:hypothetical protein
MWNQEGRNTARAKRAVGLEKDTAVFTPLFELVLRIVRVQFNLSITGGQLRSYK